ncbi:TatD family hydrolase [bacterium]|nr:TatD family hydrolase [bacterium]
MSLIDTHCHLSYYAAEEIPGLLERANQCGITRAISIGAGEGAESAKQAIKLAETYQNVWASVGIHPHDAGQYTTVETIETLAQHPRVVAIGETGLDFFRDWAPQANQEKLFIAQIELAKKVNKPLIIHCRDAAAQTLKILLENQADHVGGVFHCYSEDAQFAAELRKINFMVSFTGSLTFKKATALREAAREIPLDQIMLETDTPYMAPEPFRGAQSEPMHVLKIAEMLAQVKAITLEEVAEISTKNALRLFRLC